MKRWYSASRRRGRGMQRVQTEMVEKVDHPSHYGGDTKYEAIKVIDDWGLGEGFAIGSALKYLCRAPHKGSEEEDLHKAHWYLRHAASKHQRVGVIRRLKRLVSRERAPTRPQPSALHFDDIATAWCLEGVLREVLGYVAQGNYTFAANMLQVYVNEKFGRERDVSDAK